MADGLDFSGTGVLVTGGASGIGRATVDAFAARGAAVAVCDLDPEQTGEVVRALGNRHVAAPGDVSQPDQVDALVATARAGLGRIDVLVNCAGVSDSFSPTAEQTIEHWQRIIDINLTGTYLTCRAVAPDMMAAGGGAIVNISSIAGLAGLPRRNAYTASKHGVAGLTRALACEWAQQGVRVNAVAPGYIRTPHGPDPDRGRKGRRDADPPPDPDGADGRTRRGCRSHGLPRLAACRVRDRRGDPRRRRLLRLRRRSGRGRHRGAADRLNSTGIRVGLSRTGAVPDITKGGDRKSWAFYELRQYTVRPGKMEQWLELMEGSIIPFQVSQGMVICGSFRGETDDSVYVWLRRFESEAQREAQYAAVYESDTWKNEIAPQVGDLIDREVIKVQRIVPTSRSTAQ